MTIRRGHVNPLASGSPVRRWARAETVRQQAHPSTILPLAQAYVHAVDNPELITTVPGVVSLHDMFEPAHAGIRRVPVVFNQGIPAPPAQQVPGALNSLFRFVGDIDTDSFVHEFLKIHPFTDGNGRTGSILYNVLNKNGYMPVMMPHYRFD